MNLAIAHFQLDITKSRCSHRRFGGIDASLIQRIRGLSIEQLSFLGEALLDFSVVADLEAWLNLQAG
ncbi:DUF4351 domain-containing protein [Nostoc parmelioides FACHB-3921]|uniref:DUF4351 domain-containing protein n=1 Tax=Nostoc parmelioides FACHB-3921 TaxID=2692909 RepID=A0ABR8BLR0_9NOSO|nr:DUF4351 domain-containing protein [Nostoc parmelioides FACHB-3921]